MRRPRMDEIGYWACVVLGVLSWGMFRAAGWIRAVDDALADLEDEPPTPVEVRVWLEQRRNGR